MSEFKQRFDLDLLNVTPLAKPEQEDFFHALCVGDLESMTILVVNQQADVDFIHPDTGANLLTLVILNDDDFAPKIEHRDAVIAHLIQLNANVNHLTQEKSVLMAAVTEKDHKTVALLCRSGSLDLDLPQNKSILPYALKHFDEACFARLCESQLFDLNQGVLNNALQTKNLSAVQILCACEALDLGGTYRSALTKALDAVNVVLKEVKVVGDGYYEKFRWKRKKVGFKFDSTDVDILQTLLLQDNIQGDLSDNMKSILHSDDYNKQREKQISEYVQLHFEPLYTARKHIRLMFTVATMATTNRSVDFRQLLIAVYHSCPLMLYNHVVALVKKIHRGDEDSMYKGYLHKLLSVLLTLPARNTVQQDIFSVLGLFIFQHGQDSIAYRYQLSILCLLKSALRREESVFLVTSYCSLSGESAAPDTTLASLMADEKMRAPLVSAMIDTQLQYHRITKQSRYVSSDTVKHVITHSDDLMTQVEYFVAHTLHVKGLTGEVLLAQDAAVLKADIVKAFQEYINPEAKRASPSPKASVLAQSMTAVTGGGSLSEDRPRDSLLDCTSVEIDEHIGHAKIN